MTETVFDRLEQPKKYPYSFEGQAGVNKEDLEKAVELVRLESEIDPFGQIPGVIVFVVGDTHIPRSEPEDEPTVMMQPYKTISRLNPGNPKWYQGERQTAFASTWFAEVEEIKMQLTSVRDLLTAGYVPVVVHVGDRGADAELIGDMEQAFLTVTEGLASVSDEFAGVKAVLLPGDHEFDRKRHGPAVREREAELLGGKLSFCQRVGSGQLLLGVTTSLVGDVGDDENMTEWKKRQEEVIAQAKKVAAEEGRRIIIFGHEREKLQLLSEREKLPVAAEFSGHKHRGKVQETEGIISGTVGTPTTGAFGLEVTLTPSIIELILDGKAGNLARDKVKRVEVEKAKIEGLM